MFVRKLESRDLEMEYASSFRSVRSETRQQKGFNFFALSSQKSTPKIWSVFFIFPPGKVRTLKYRFQLNIQQCD
jgi:hypothetical protein